MSKGINIFIIDCEAGEFIFEHIDEQNGMIQLRLLQTNEIFFYEPGDSYLYDQEEGGTAHSLGEVYEYGVQTPQEPSWTVVETDTSDNDVLTDALLATVMAEDRALSMAQLDHMSHMQDLWYAI
jgi:hypothetical protein